MTETSSGSRSENRSARAPRRRPVVLLDANILFLPPRNGFPLESEIDRLRPGAVPSVPTSVVVELDRLAEGGTPHARAARAFSDRFPRVPSVGRGDDAVVRTALRERASVATADRDLGIRLLARGIEVLVPRDRHRLEIHSPRPAGAFRRREPLRSAPGSS